MTRFEPHAEGDLAVMSLPAFDSITFRHIMGHYPTGVCVVTAMHGEEKLMPTAMVVGSFTSVSLEPPLVAFLPAKSSRSWPLIEKAGRFCVNVLAGDQRALCEQMSGPEKFAGIAYVRSDGGSPILPDVLAWIDCELDAVHEAGDHYIVVGRVIGLKAEGTGKPLLFFKGGYGEFADFG